MADIDRPSTAQRFRKPIATTGLALLEDAGRQPDRAPVLCVARGSIAAASVATLNATPVEVIAAPGAGEYIEVVSCHWMLDHQGVDYDGAAAGEDLSLKYTNAAGAKVTDDVDHSGFADASADAHAIVKGVAVTPVANAAIVAHVLSGEWFAAAGDGILQYEIVYMIRRLAIDS